MRMGVFWAVVNVELRKLMSYRFDFWFNYLVSLLVRMGISYFVFKAIFENAKTETIMGFDFPTLNLYLVLAYCARRVVLNNADGQINEDIYSGGLNRYLVQPVDLLAFKYAGHFAGGILALLQSMVALLLYLVVFGFEPFAAFSLVGAAFALCAVLIASITYFFVSIAIDSVAFFADHVWSLHVMFRFCFEFAGGIAVPLAFFPVAVGVALKNSPFYFMASFPVDCLLGKITYAAMLQGLLVSVVWCGVFYVFCKLIYAWGLKRYSGIGM
jgi:ABC-2 type transport system permease protein